MFEKSVFFHVYPSLNRGGRWIEVRKQQFSDKKMRNFGKWPLKGGWPLNRRPLNRGPTVLYVRLDFSFLEFAEKWIGEFNYEMPFQTLHIWFIRANNIPNREIFFLNMQGIADMLAQQRHSHPTIWRKLYGWYSDLNFTYIYLTKCRQQQLK